MAALDLVGISIQALGTAAAGGAAIFALRSSRAAARSADIALAESNRRTRPWLKLTNLEISFDYDVAPQTGTLKVRYENIGALAAFETVLRIRMAPEGDIDSLDEENLEPIEAEISLGVVFPNEPSDWRVQFGLQLAFWNIQNQRLSLEGELTYALGTEDAFATQFLGSVRSDLPGTPVEWHHTGAT